MLDLFKVIPHHNGESMANYINLLLIRSVLDDGRSSLNGRISSILLYFPFCMVPFSRLRRVKMVVMHKDIVLHFQRGHSPNSTKADKGVQEEQNDQGSYHLMIQPRQGRRRGTAWLLERVHVGLM
jgi:hypothetical protein